jgi:hypothetical protein
MNLPAGHPALVVLFLIPILLETFGVPRAEGILFILRSKARHAYIEHCAEKSPGGSAT